MLKHIKQFKNDNMYNIRWMGKFLSDAIFIELGLIVSSFGTALFYSSDLGSSAMATFCDGLHQILNISYGQANTLSNIVLLFVLLLLNRSYINIGTILCVFTIGPWVDIFNRAMAYIDVCSAALWVRILISMLGAAMMGLGLGAYVAVNRGFGALEGIVKVICSRTRINMSQAKIIQDVTLVIMGILLGATWGLGTLIGVFMTGPILHCSCVWVGTIINRKTAQEI